MWRFDFVGLWPITLSSLSPQSAAAPLPLYALLLFNDPSVLTLRTLFALPGFGDRSHQLRAVRA